jgi:hypothetical protein
MAEYRDPFHGAIWDATDADALKSFLLTRAGKRFIMRLRLDRPSLPSSPADAGNLNLVAMTAKKQEGYEETIANMFEYTIAPADEEAKTKSYPNLDDDDAWPEELRNPTRPESPPPPPNEAAAELEAQTKAIIEGSK